jgi:light-regulated signal transduction histidine kinase (bacteriophytochrome)
MKSWRGDPKAGPDLDDVACLVSGALAEPPALSSHCQILLEDYRDRLDEASRERLAALVGLCRRLEKLIDDSLIYARGGTAELAGEQVDLNRVVAGLLTTLGPAIQRRGGRVVVEGRLPEVTANAALLGYVFRNLIAHGVESNGGEGKIVTIGCRDGDPPTLTVRAGGTGAEQRRQGAISGLFRRLYVRPSDEAIGAGLAIVRSIVEARGGRVWVESKPGRGTTFCFTVPPVAVQEASDTAGAEADSSPEEQAPLDLSLLPAGQPASRRS